MTKDATPEIPRAAAMLIVGCRLPHGVLCEMGDRESEDYRAVRIVGTLHAGESDKIEGAAITRNVPADFWQAWVEGHKKLSFVKKQFLYWSDNLEDVQAWAFDGRKLITGLEPSDPRKPPPGIVVDPKSLLLATQGGGLGSKSPYDGANRHFRAGRGAPG